MDCLKPKTSILIKLGSIAVHADEATGKNAHEFDVTALRALLQDNEIIAWLKQMDEMALIPKKRE